MTDAAQKQPAKPADTDESSKQDAEAKAQAQKVEKERQVKAKQAEESLADILENSGVSTGRKKAKKKVEKESPEKSPEQSPEKPKDEKSAQSESGESESGDRSDKSKYSDEDVRQSIEALQRHGAPKSVLDAASKGDEEMIAFGLDRREAQRKSEESYRRVKEELADVRKKAEQTDITDSKAESSKGDEPVDVSKMVEPLAARLSDLLGDDVSKETRESFESLVELMQKSVSSSVAERDSQIAMLRDQTERIEQRYARDALLSEYPHLKDSETWESVLERSKKIDEPDMLTRLDHAARIELAPEMVREAREQRRERNKKRDDGLPESQSTRKSKENTSADKEHAEREWLLAIHEGRESDADEWKRRYQELNR